MECRYARQRLIKIILALVGRRVMVLVGRARDESCLSKEREELGHGRGWQRHEQESMTRRDLLRDPPMLHSPPT